MLSRKATLILIQAFGDRFKRAFDIFQKKKFYFYSFFDNSISAIYLSHNDKYGIYIDADTQLCHCWNHRRYKHQCKHIIALVLRTISKNLLTEKEGVKMLVRRSDIIV